MDININNLSLSLGSKPALKEVSLELAGGKLHVIIGPNGAGKSTLLRCLAGLLLNYTGQIELGDRGLNTLTLRQMAAFRAFLPQHFQLTEDFSVRHVLSLFGNLDDLPETAIISRFLDRRFRSLSGGEQQMVAWEAHKLQVAKADDRIFLLDEPVAALDLKFQRHLLEEAKQQANEGHLVLVVLHDLNLALAYADELHLIKDGQMVQKGVAPEHLKSEWLEEIYEVPITLTKTERGLRVLH